jgi:hypothetical protein
VLTLPRKFATFMLGLPMAVAGLINSPPVDPQVRNGRMHSFAWEGWWMDES